MALPPQLAACLADLTKHCEKFQAQNKALLDENARLKAQLASVGKIDMVNDVDVVELPGIVLPAKNDSQPPKESWGVNMGEGADKVTTVKSGDVRAIQDSDDSIAASKVTALTKKSDENAEMRKIGSVQEYIQVFEGKLDKKNSSPCLRFIEMLVGTIAFKALTMLAIAANTVYLGMMTELQLKGSWDRLEERRPKDTGDPPVPPGDIVFASWFAIEIALRMIAERRDFFRGEAWRWNAFDTFLVIESVVGAIFNTGAKLSFLRIMRVFRLVRVVRVVRTVKALRSLRTMIFSIINCFTDLMWAFVMITLIIFVFGIIFVNAVTSYYDSISWDSTAQMDSVKEIHECFGGLYPTMTSLWAAISGGNDWMQYGTLLKRLDPDFGEVYFGLFAFYVAFCVVGLLNVVTGIFVDSAVCTRTYDEVVESYTEDLKNTTEEVKRIFFEADTDGSGTLSFEELKSHLANPWVKAYFAGMDIDPSEAKIIFTLIDVDKSGEVSIDEFVTGTMKLKGPAKSLDVIALMYDSARQNAKFNALCNYVETQFAEVKEAVKPGLGASHSGFLHTVRTSSLLDQNTMSTTKDLP